MQVQFEVSFNHEATREEAIEQAKREFVQFVADCTIDATVADVDQELRDGVPGETITYWLITMATED